MFVSCVRCVLCRWRPLRRTEHSLNRLTPNAPLTSKRCILYIYSTNIGTEYFKHALHSPFFFSSKCSLFHNANLFGPCIIHILYTGCAKIKKNNSGAKGLKESYRVCACVMVCDIETSTMGRSIPVLS